MDIFQQASRIKARFDSPKGLLTVEDLWDLPLTSATGKANLDDIARGLHRALKETAEVSFVKPASTKPTDDQLCFDIVKFVIDTKMAERDAAAQETERKAKKQRILELIAKKQDETLEGKSEEELRQLAESL